MTNKEYSFDNSEERIVIFDCIKNTTKINILEMWIEFIEKTKNWIL